MLLDAFRAVDFFVPALAEREALDFLAPDFEELERAFEDDLLVVAGDLAITCVLSFSAQRARETHLPSEETKSSVDVLVQQTRDLRTTLSTGYFPQQSSRSNRARNLRSNNPPQQHQTEQGIRCCA